MKYIEYYKAHKDKIYSYFLYNLGNQVSLAEDLTSDTFLKAFEKFASYREEYKFSTWIYTIARNTLYDYYRKNKTEVLVDDVSEANEKEFLSYEDDFLQDLNITMQMEQVLTALHKIPPDQREILIMKYLDDFSTKEISEITTKSPANIRKILSRGLCSVRKFCIPL